MGELGEFRPKIMTTDVKTKLRDGYSDESRSPQ